MISEILEWYVFGEVVHVEVMVVAIQGERVFVDSDRKDGVVQVGCKNGFDTSLARR
jgi:hypothetical protein